MDRRGEYDYLYTRIYSNPDPQTGARAIGCIPPQYANAFVRTEPSVPKIDFEPVIEKRLESNAAFQKRIGPWMELIDKTISERNNLLDSLVSRIEESDKPPWPDIPSGTELESLVDRTTLYERQLSKLDRTIRDALDEWDQYRESVLEALEQYGASDNTVIERAFGVSDRPVGTALYDPQNRIQVKRIQGQLRQENPDATEEEAKQYMEEQNAIRKVENAKLVERTPLALRIIGILNTAASQLDRSLERVRSIVSEEQERIDATRNTLSEMIHLQKQILDEQREIARANAAHEFELINRFPDYSSEDTNIFIPDTYRQLQDIPVPDLYALSRYDAPGSVDFWGRWLLSKYATEPNRTKNRSLKDFVESGEPLRTPLKNPVPIRQFFDVVRRAMDLGAITRADLALSELAHDLWVGTMSIPEEQLNLLPRYIREMAEQLVFLIDQQQRVNVRAESLRREIGGYKAMEVLKRIKSLGGSQEELENLLVQTYTIGDTEIRPFDTKEDARIWIDEYWDNPLDFDVQYIRALTLELTDDLSKVEKEIERLSEENVVNLAERVNFAISSYLTNKLWPSRREIEQFAEKPLS
jgi:hypothetical protein